MAGASSTGISNSQLLEDMKWMSLAVEAAREAAAIGEVPVGAVIIGESGLLSRGYNRREIDQDPLAHAELLAIRQAAEKIGSWRLIGCTMYVTLEPCAMCAGALVNSRVSTLVFGAKDPKAGYCGSLGDLVKDPRLNHRLALRHGVFEEVCSGLLRDFFVGLRKRPGSRAD